MLHPVPALLTAAAILWAVVPMRGEIASYIDDKGRRMFTNEEVSPRIRRAKSSQAQPLRAVRRRHWIAEMDDHINRVAQQNRVDPKLVRAIIEAESSWDPWAVSRKGAVGLMQLLPQTGRRFGARNLHDPRQNISAGVRYLRFLLDRFQNLKLALAAYNAGENIVTELGGVPPYAETEDYVERVSALYESGGRRLSSRRFGTTSLVGDGRIYQERDEHGRIVFANY